jgi:predicted nicotinamide N-methyase
LQLLLASAEDKRLAAQTALERYIAHAHRDNQPTLDQPLAQTAQAEDFVLRHTSVGRAPLVPEVRLHLAQAVLPLWEATEQWARSQLAPPFWAFAWPGSQLLGRWVLDQPEIVGGKRVLDFAAGCGLAALCCVLSGAARVIASDIDPFAAMAQRLNAELNALEIDSIVDDLVGSTPDVDVVLAGDVCYDRAQAAPITDWLHHLAGAGKLVLLADPTRAYAPTEHVHLLQLRDVPTLQQLESATSRQTRLLRVLPR